MQRQSSFGRRAQREPQAKAAAKPKPVPSNEIRSAAVSMAQPAAADLIAPALELDAKIDREVEDWKTKRKLHKRSFREPWRSVSIAAAIGFGLSSWLLPDSVASVTGWLTSGLALAAFIAGFRKPPSG
ncbi:MAG: hypothetical protein KGM97_05045 [Alphaproteobacteria bacterium]|nr:hypothetical protein [Alphaproteobacteria bacterium]MDE2630340.1 hypothetical protein [Alphaproteobacteria bacterium]